MIGSTREGSSGKHKGRIALRRAPIELAADSTDRPVLKSEFVRRWPELLREVPGGFDIIPILAATRVRLATVAVINSWNRVFARPKDRACRIPNWTSRASRCSATWRS